jgi:ActR/RegA family two-component response regulator
LADQPDAFLSYTRIDDEFYGGAITSLRKSLELGVQVVTGNRNFSIFQDIEGVELGQQWQKRLDEAITTTRFLIPVLTPLFFNSSACRDELGKFVEHEKHLGRDDLILPIYFVTVPTLEKPDLLKQDALASEINARERYDWRPRAALPINDPQVRSAVLELSQKIGLALTRTAAVGVPPAHDEAARQAEFAKASDRVQREEIPRQTATVKRVLWVDDRPNNNIYERRAMEAYNVEFTLALSTDEALAHLKNNKFDAIISDMGRPPDPQAGYTLLGAVRTTDERTPFFIYAGSRDPKHLREAIRRGAQGSTNVAAELIADVFQSIGISQSET